MRNTTAVSRRVVGGSSLRNPTADMRASSTSGPAPTLQRAVVVEVFDNPRALTNDEKQRIAGNVNNPEVVDTLPNNSVIARLITDSADSGNPISTILFPFFSSYIEMPIVPGEHIYVIYADLSRTGTTTGYWLSRVSEQSTIEDVNYNVPDRRFFPEYNPQLITTNDRGRTNETSPGFPNGGDTEGSFTLRVTGSNGENPYEGIINGSAAVRNFTFEPVPRYNKRAGEMVIQGKNNSAIILGEDRVGSVVRAEADAPGGQAGSIDLVAGRARKLPESDSTEPEGTAPRVITNSRNKREVNKTPYLNEGRTDNPREGDPDFVTDAARLLITMQSEVDVNFGITDLRFPAGVLKPEQPNAGAEGTLGKSYVLAKADNIRMIARSIDATGEDNDIKGTVLIIREGHGGGVQDGRDVPPTMAYLFIDEDGELQIFAPKIFLGKATEEAEPYIKWSEFKNTINHLQDEIDTLKSKLQTQLDEVNTKYANLCTALATGFSSTVAVPNAPIASLVTAGGTIATLPTGLATVISTNRSLATRAVTDGKQNTDNDIENSKSTRIFGE